MSKNDSEYLNNLRHSCAHLLAKAVKDLWPGTHNAIGPAIENGFYQDFDFGDRKISDADLPEIEEKMRIILKTWEHFDYKEVTLKDAKKLFSDNPYKLELAEEFAKGGKKLLTNNPGNFLDLCKMTHVENPKKEMQHFKLLKLAGAYWRGNEKNKMLTRIYGTCFPAKEELDKYLWQQEEAKKRDHKKLGKELSLFIFSNSVGPGLPLFMPKGMIIRRVIENYLVKLKESYGHHFVWTPHIARSELYKQSKHWQKYEAMMPPLKLEDEEYTLKPMNCPHHFQIYLANPRSYRDLPLRLAENTTVYRYEKSGVINGLFRVRSVTQDDSHWFIPHNLIPSEIDHAIKLTKQIYEDFGLSKFHARISIRDKKNPDKYLGELKVWESAEKELAKAVSEKNIPYSLGEGEAAFYGPKIDFMVEDSLGREWQLTTIQLDFNQPENFDLTYTDEKGEKKRPAVLHIAILGSIERFLGILIEHYGGAFPTWLAPVQAIVLPISDKHKDYAHRIYNQLTEVNLRIEEDNRNETLGSKIRTAELQKIPYVIIVGDKEIKESTISTRRRHEKQDLGQMRIKNFIFMIQKAIDNKTNN
ncbi:threonine--tRNA ligase [Candidatus Gottesmanbacteria bacterium]|nr:threonine--tRNA ligase [Candidatus Gottesmanbacteria bacterium]